MEEINEGTYVYTYLHGMVYTHLLSMSMCSGEFRLKKKEEEEFFEKALSKWETGNRLIRDKLVLALQSEWDHHAPS